MNALIVSFMLVCLTAVLAAPQEKYTSKYDNFDIDSVLGNDRILKNYIKCLMDSGPCTREGKDLKQILPEALATSCSKCTPSQRRIMRKLSKHVMANKPDDWAKLTDKYDHDHKYKATFDKFVNEDN